MFLRIAKRLLRLREPIRRNLARHYKILQENGGYF